MDKLKKNYKPLIIVLSLAVPIIVALLYVIPKSSPGVGFNIHILPAINAGINSMVSILLIVGFILIRQKRIEAHKKVMLTAVGLSVAFLLNYVAFHYLAEPTSFGGTGMIKSVYYFILITHIILAAIIVPLVLITLTRGLGKDYTKHKKIARWTWPLWLYVSLTGVAVYFLIAPYY